MKPDQRSIISPDWLFLTTELQKGVLKGVDENLFPRYNTIMGHSKTPIPDWMSKEDYILAAICRGLGYPDMKFSDIINHALVAGMLEVAAFQAGLEKELHITESG